MREDAEPVSPGWGSSWWSALEKIGLGGGGAYEHVDVERGPRRTSRARRWAMVLSTLALAVLLSAVSVVLVRERSGDGWLHAEKPLPVGAEERTHIQEALRRQLRDLCAHMVQRRQACGAAYDCLLQELLPVESDDTAGRSASWLAHAWHRWWRSLRERRPGYRAVQSCVSSNNTRAISAAALRRIATLSGCQRTEKRRLWLVYIVRNEARLLLQNILHHLALGAEHFLVFDNESVDNVRQALQPLVEQGLVTYRRIGGQGVQLVAYDNALRVCAADGIKWLGAIDADEFIISTNTTCLPDLLDEVLERYGEHTAAVKLNWRMVGRYPRMLDAEGFPAEKANYSIGKPNIHVKSIVLVNRTRSFGGPHHANHAPNTEAAALDGELVWGPFVDPPQADHTAVLHFLPKEVSDWVRKRIRGRADLSREQLRSNAELYYNQDLQFFVREWMAFPAATPLPQDPLTHALQRHMHRLRAALRE
ncbi:hypothetical protein CDCA_CDCA06G1996 [Cyanidium caldarium]|uniref:Glycosyltransferase family 92 protein n=1 Tax=Cyanidium caldarium TaxID=2771 RepID=A0AAV9IUZ1_CYACA|nr:hypothetical protein CDCA_CDCA06G1996 [Cyanidium caldarium]